MNCAAGFFYFNQIFYLKVCDRQIGVSSSPFGEYSILSTFESMVYGKGIKRNTC